MLLIFYLWLVLNIHNVIMLSHILFYIIRI